VEYNFYVGKKAKVFLPMIPNGVTLALFDYCRAGFCFRQDSTQGCISLVRSPNRSLVWLSASFLLQNNIAIHIASCTMDTSNY